MCGRHPRSVLALAIWCLTAGAVAEEAAKPPEPKPQAEADKTEKPAEPKPPEKPPDVKPESKPPKAPVGSPMLTIKLAFMSDPRLFPYDLNVDMKGTTVVLSGKVSSEADKQAAAEIAQKIEGIKGVKNELDVSKDVAASIAKKKDETITHYVRERFSKSKTLDKAHFEVRTEDGVVILSGKTRFQVIVLEAAEASRHVPGVRAVNTEGIQMEGSE